MLEERTKNLIDECRRQEESCLYTSTSLFEWLKALRRWRIGFVVAPIILGGVATWPLLVQREGLEALTGFCALRAGLIPAIYKALDFDVSLDTVARHAHEFKSLQDRFRQAWRIKSHEKPEVFRVTFDELTDRMDAARAASLTPPERLFKKAQDKIGKGDYSFAADCEEAARAKAASA